MATYTEEDINNFKDMVKTDRTKYMRSHSDFLDFLIDRAAWAQRRYQAMQNWCQAPHQQNDTVYVRGLSD